MRVFKRAGLGLLAAAVTGWMTGPSAWGQVAARVEVRGGGGVAGFRGMNQGWATASAQVPVIDTKRLVEARRELTAAEGKAGKASMDFAGVRRKLEREVEEKPEVVAAAEALAAARAELEAASKPVLAVVEATPAYQEATARLAAANAKVAALQADAKVLGAERGAAAAEAMNARTVVSRMQNEALGADAAVVAAREKSQAAAAALAELRQGLGEFAGHPEFVEAKRAAEAARGDVIEARKKVDEAQQDVAEQSAARDRAIEALREENRREMVLRQAQERAAMEYSRSISGRPGR